MVLHKSMNNLEYSALKRVSHVGAIQHMLLFRMTEADYVLAQKK